jgi:hypothetical protein
LQTQAEGRVLLGTVFIKHLQTLIWWVRDDQKRGLALEAANFYVAAMNDAAEMKNLRHELNDKKPSISNLGKFDPNDFDAHEDAFMDLLAQSNGVLCEPLHNIIRPDTAPVTFTTEEKRCMYQFPLTGSSFELDNQAVFRKLKVFLIDSPGWAWIKPHDASKNGRAAYMAWTAHYNGEGELSKCTSNTKSRLDGLHYRNE